MKGLTILTLFIVFVFTSCTYYESGPNFTLKSANTRISGEWQLSDVIINDKTDPIELEKEQDIIYTFAEDGNLLLTQKSNIKADFSATGTWQFDDKKANLILSVENLNEDLDIINSQYLILKLTDSELWISDENCENRESDYIIERRYTKISE